MDGPLSIILLLLIAAVVLATFRWLRSPNGPFLTVFEWEHAIAYRDGRFDQILPPGRHFDWRPRRRNVQGLRRNDQLPMTAPIDVTSSDKLVYRVATTLMYRIADPRESFENNYLEKANLAAATALVNVASTRTLEGFLTERTQLEAELLAASAPRSPAARFLPQRSARSSCRRKSGGYSPKSSGLAWRAPPRSSERAANRPR